MAERRSGTTTGGRVRATQQLLTCSARCSPEGCRHAAILLAPNLGREVLGGRVTSCTASGPRVPLASSLSVLAKAREVEVGGEGVQMSLLVAGCCWTCAVSC